MSFTEPARALLSAELARVAQGDKAALRTVYDLTSAKLFGICLHFLPDRALAEDVVQEVYLKVWQNAAAFDPQKASPITWLCMIARNRAIDWQRASGRYEAAVRAAGDVMPAEAGELGSDVEERHRLLHQCLNSLESEPRSSISSAFMEGFTYSELATRASVPLGTMKSWVRRGLAQLRKCIEDA
ncbi:sigma-70 family RNA polymerase sigma factor [Sphingomonas sp. M1-B02]|uniref:sigma-70 family RNA polymerase sigma factor n=1 Tax=Sphingomonas sp. M1-B02 TaxID=3114300 RepID=UPI00223F61FE|nr:sigma-70 family RNA polymerase sigma factor [Sphingomonas sp. S6-11]UZK67676.1 sigma-70 family RNA polymerase sigma factor [Sphingomonas sp. S6-11]